MGAVKSPPPPPPPSLPLETNEHALSVLIFFCPFCRQTYAANQFGQGVEWGSRRCGEQTFCADLKKLAFFYDSNVTYFYRRQ